MNSFYGDIQKCLEIYRFTKKTIAFAFTRKYPK